MPKLTDTRLLVLSTASQRETLNLMPLPDHLKGGAIPKVLHALIAGSLVAEVDAVDGEPVRRRSDDGRETRPILTNADLAALGIEPVTPSSVPAPVPLDAVDSMMRPRRKVGVIEIDLGGGRRIRVDRDIDAEALRRVLDVQGGR